MAGKELPNNIVVLKFSRNECYLEIVRMPPKGLKLDLEARTWVSYRGAAMPFGKADYLAREYSRADSVVGVYDLLDFDQAKALVSRVQDIARER
jgi:hypothetical protein